LKKNGSAYVSTEKKEKNYKKLKILSRERRREVSTVHGSQAEREIFGLVGGHVVVDWSTDVQFVYCYYYCCCWN
jgi:hypothetical protein